MEETQGNENKDGSKQDVGLTTVEGQVDYQNCMLHSFSCYLEEAEAFNRHLTDLAKHTAR